MIIDEGVASNALLEGQNHDYRRGCRLKMPFWRVKVSIIDEAVD
jgi:hypothetical protein